MKDGTYSEKDREKEDQVANDEQNCQAIRRLGLRRVLNEALGQRATEGDGRQHV